MTMIINNELLSMWQDTVVVYFKALPPDLPAGIEESMESFRKLLS
jgi:hypothetical protein